VQEHVEVAQRDAQAARALLARDLFDQPQLEHLAIARHDPTQREELRATIHQLLRGYEDDAKALLYQTQELRDYAQRQWENNDMRSRAVVEAHTKIRSILVKISSLLDEANNSGRPTDKVLAVKQEIESIQQRMLEAL